MMTLLTAFLNYGLNPLQEPRGSLSKVKSVQEMLITRQDFCELVSEMRDFLYCLYDSNYFEQGEQRNQTLTQSMLAEQISMSPKKQFLREREFPSPDHIQSKNFKRKRRNSSPSCD